MLTLLKTGLCFLRPKGASEAHLYNLLQNYNVLTIPPPKLKLNEILVVNEAAPPTNTKKETKFGLSVFTGRYEKHFRTEFATKS